LQPQNRCVATGEISQTLTSLMVPVITAAVGTAGLMVQDRRRKKDFTHRQRAQMEKAQLEVQFVSSWIQARKLLEPATDVYLEAEGWLDRCYRSAKEVSSTEPPKPGPPIWRRLLVLWPLVGGAAKIARAAYWISIVLVNLLWLTFLGFFFAWMSPGGQYEGEAAALYLFESVIFSLPSVYLRYLCLALDKKTRSSN
jgi:hypothetical protein